MRISKAILPAALLVVGSLSALAPAASAATATGRASARIVQPTRIAVAPTAGWTASVHSQAGRRVVETELSFSTDRARDYSVAVTLEKDDAPLGANETTETAKSNQAKGFVSETRLRVEMPDSEADLDHSHVRIVLHNH